MEELPFTVTLSQRDQSPFGFSEQLISFDGAALEISYNSSHWSMDYQEASPPQKSSGKECRLLSKELAAGINEITIRLLLVSHMPEERLYPLRLGRSRTLQFTSMSGLSMGGLSATDMSGDEWDESYALLEEFFRRVMNAQRKRDSHDERILQLERDALRALAEDVSIPLDNPPEPLQYLGFSKVSDRLRLGFYFSKASDRLGFYYVPQTGHFYAVYTVYVFSKDAHTRQCEPIVKSEALLFAETLADGATAAGIGSMWEDDSAEWKPKLHCSPETDDGLKLPEIPAPPKTEEEARALEEAALKAFRGIDWDHAKGSPPVPGTIFLWDGYYYVPAIRKFYKVEPCGNYYHGYDSDISECAKSAVFFLRMYYFDKTINGSDICEVLEQAVKLCSAYRLASQLPDG